MYILKNQVQLTTPLTKTSINNLNEQLYIFIFSQLTCLIWYERYLFANTFISAMSLDLKKKRVLLR